MIPLCEIDNCGLPHNRKRHLEIARLARKPPCINGCDRPQHVKNAGLCLTCYRKELPYLQNGKYRKYGITYEQYKQMWANQKGLCAICKSPETKISRHNSLLSLAVDHDHQTGVVRALLCNGCNLGLGNFQENIEVLEAAIKYVKEWEGK